MLGTKDAFQGLETGTTWDARDLTCCDQVSLDFNSRSFKTVVHYVCWMCEDPRTLTIEKLNWTLWYIDRSIYLQKGKGLTSATYRKFPEGPMAVPTSAAVRELEKEGALARRVDEDGNHRFFATKKPDISLLQAEQVSLLDSIIHKTCLGADSHIAGQEGHDRVFRVARIGEEIPYFTVLAGRSGHLTDDDIQWTAERIKSPRQSLLVSDFDSLRRAHRRAIHACAALVWHILREPEVGSSLFAPKSSWFVYKQQGVHCDVPDLTAVYTFLMDELVFGGLRFDHDSAR